MVVNTPEEMAEEIKRRAKTQHIVLKDMLVALDTGVNYIQEMKKKSVSPTAHKLARIAEYLGCTVNDLIYRGDDASK